MGIPDVRVEFFNAYEDDPEYLSTFLLELVRGLRKKHCEYLSEVMAGANAQVQNFAEEQVHEAQRQAARRILVWIRSNEQIDSSALSLQNRLIQAIEEAHASSLRASVRRQGEWYNLEYSPQLSHGALLMAVKTVAPKLESFKAVTDNLLQDPELEDAFDLVQQAYRILDSGVNDFLQKSQLLGRAIHTQDMMPDTRFWDLSEAEWGQGPGYRNRVSRHHQNWFGDSSDNIYQARVQELVEREWQRILGRIEAILERDE